MLGADDKLEIYRDKRGNYRWRRVALNGRVVGASPGGYGSRKDCEASMNRGPNSGDAWEFYRDRAGAWRWRRTAQNGSVVGAATEGYGSRADAEANARRQGYS